MVIENDRLLRALRLEPNDRPPVWLMRQAGRYLPEYRKVRAQAGSFMDLCRNAELASEVAMQPLRRYPLDASILFSDILTIPDAMGLGLQFLSGEGPVFERPIKTLKAIESLPLPDVDQELGYVTDVLRAMRMRIGDKLPIIGFSGSPWTLACYMLEGRGTRDFSTARSWLWREPRGLQLLLDKLSTSITDYLAAQADAGADVLMLFDTWGGLLSEAHYQIFSLQPMKTIIEQLRSRHNCTLPVILFSKGCHTQISDMLKSGCAGVGVDWRIDINAALKQTRGKAALQGNLDPTVLLADADSIQTTVRTQFAEAVGQTGFIFNLGHGIMPEASPEGVTVLLEALHSMSG